MTLNEYQAFASQGIHSATLEREPIVGFALGLAGEAGEVIDDIKKRIFHGRVVPIEHTAEELGDVLWYVANIATTYNLNLEGILEENVRKLTTRYPEKYSADNQAGNCYVERRGPHLALFNSDGKFIKFLNKEEKKRYELDTKDRATSSDCSGEGPEHVRDSLPWE